LHAPRSSLLPDDDTTQCIVQLNSMLTHGFSRPRSYRTEAAQEQAGQQTCDLQLPPPLLSPLLPPAPQLLRVEADGAFSNLLSSAAPPSAAQQAATRLVSGVTVWRRLLDHTIDNLYDGGAGPLELPVRTALRVALYELQICVPPTPEHAAVSEAVGLVRALRRPRAAALVNALLRRALRSSGNAGPELPLGVRFSMPDWIVDRWLRRFGEAQTALLLAASNRSAPAFGVRPSNLSPGSLSAFAERLAALNVAFAPSPLLPQHFLRVEGSVSALLPLLRAGEAALQDEAAALVVSFLDPRPGEKLADICAAPGGKALYAASLGASVLAIDVSASRAAMIRAAAQSHSLPPTSLQVLQADAVSWSSDSSVDSAFDCVLVDAPCTGLGVLSKRADLRWRRQEADISESAQRALALLTAGARAVRVGGRLVFSTCSTEAEENEGVVAAFLAMQPEGRWVIEPADEATSRNGGRLPAAALSACGRFLAPLPHVTQTDGAFAARLRRLS